MAQKLAREAGMRRKNRILVWCVGVVRALGVGGTPLEGAVDVASAVGGQGFAITSSSVAVGQEFVDLSWTGGTGQLVYYLARYPDNKTWVLAANATSFHDTGLSANKLYCYVVV